MSSSLPPLMLKPLARAFWANGDKKSGSWLSFRAIRAIELAHCCSRHDKSLSSTIAEASSLVEEEAEDFEVVALDNTASSKDVDDSLEDRTAASAEVEEDDDEEDNSESLE